METQNQWQEAKEEMGEMLRFTEQPRNAEDTSIYLGEIIEGVYVGKKVNIGQNDSNIYEIKMAGDRLVNMWGSKLIDGKFSIIPFNSTVHVQYLGLKQPATAKGKAYNDYKIMFIKPGFVEAVPVATAPVAQAPVAPVAPVATLVAQAPAGVAVAPATAVAPEAPLVNAMGLSKEVTGEDVPDALKPLAEATVPLVDAPDGGVVTKAIPF